MRLKFCCVIWMVAWEFRKPHEIMDKSCLVSNVQVWHCRCDGVDLAHFGSISTNWAYFKCHTLAEYYCWQCPSLYDHSGPSYDGCFQQGNPQCPRPQIISNWFLEHGFKFAVLKWPRQPPALNLIEHLWDVVEQENCIIMCNQQVTIVIIMLYLVFRAQTLVI